MIIRERCLANERKECIESHCAANKTVPEHKRVSCIQQITKPVLNKKALIPERTRLLIGAASKLFFSIIIIQNRVK